MVWPSELLTFTENNILFTWVSSISAQPTVTEWLTQDSSPSLICHSWKKWAHGLYNMGSWKFPWGLFPKTQAPTVSHSLSLHSNPTPEIVTNDLQAEISLLHCGKGTRRFGTKRACLPADWISVTSSGVHSLPKVLPLFHHPSKLRGHPPSKILPLLWG